MFENLENKDAVIWQNLEEKKNEPGKGGKPRKANF